MKKVILSMVFFGVMSAGLVHADDLMKALKGDGQYGTAGCGLGSMVFGNQPGIVQVFAATTNVTGIQVFGITTGTSNCGPGIMAASNTRLNEFMVANLDSVAKEMAIGRGESLDAMAELMAIPAGERVAVYGVLQANYASIFTSEQIQVNEVLDNIASVVKI